MQSKFELKTAVNNSRQNKLGVNNLLKEHIKFMMSQPISD